MNEVAKVDERVTAHNATLASITPVKHWVEYFKAAKAIWHKSYGSYPTPQMLTAAVALTNKHQRPGIECLHIAMGLRPEGCSVAQYVNAATASGITGQHVGPANNKRKALVGSRWVHETVTGKPYCYMLTITAKGAAGLAGLLAAQGERDTAGKVKAKPAKPTAKATGKRKAKPATTLLATIENAQAVTVTPPEAIVPAEVAHTEQPTA